MAGYTAANNRRLAQLVRALGRHPRGQQFESATAYQINYRILVFNYKAKAVILSGFIYFYG